MNYVSFKGSCLSESYKTCSADKPSLQIRPPSLRVATDLENVEKSGNFKETSESRGICQNVREFATEFQKSGNFVV